MTKSGTKKLDGILAKVGVFPPLSEPPTREDEGKAMEISEVKNRDIFMKTCDMMFSHYRILKIVDLETAMNIIKGVLKI